MTVIETAEVTPILDRAVPTPGKGASSAIPKTGKTTVITFALLLSVMIAAAVVRETAPSLAGAVDECFDTLGRVIEYISPPYIVGYFIVLLPVVAIHELAHALVARMCGFGVSMVKIGPVRFGSRTEGNVIGDLLGAVEFKIDRLTRLGHREFWVLFAGPAANIISGGSAGIAVRYGVIHTEQYWLGILLRAFVLSSLLLGFSNLLRPSVAGFITDGGRMFILWRGGPKASRYLAILGIHKTRESGVLPRQWNARWIRTATALKDGSADEVSSALIAYIAASDKKDERLAAHRLERCLELAGAVSKRYRALLAYEAAYFQAWVRRDAKKSQEWFAEIAHPDIVTPLLAERYRTALACSLDDFSSALYSWQRGLKIVQEMPPSPRRDMLERSWVEWADEIRERQNIEAAAQ